MHACSYSDVSTHCEALTGRCVRYAPRARCGALPPKRLFLHSAALSGSFTTNAADEKGSSQMCLRAASGLPLQLKQRLEELGQGGLGEEVDARAVAAMEQGEFLCGGSVQQLSELQGDRDGVQLR